MDHYVMVIASLGNCEAENTGVQGVIHQVMTYLKRVSPSSAKVYFSVLYTKAFETVPSGFKPAEWTLGQNITDVDSTLCGLSKTRSPNKIRALEDVIHQLCDTFPVLDTYLADVICVVQKPEDFPVLEEKVELFGSFSRLVHWHRAHLSLCSIASDVKATSISSWTDLLPFRTFQSPFEWDELIVQNVAWRGSIRLNNEILGGYQLSDSENCGPSIVKDDPEVNNGHCLSIQSKLCVGERQSLDEIMTVLGKFPLSSIPPHALSPKRFTLSSPYPVTSLLLENSVAFLSQVNSDENTCFILRLGTLESVNVDNYHMDTIAWKRRVVSGNFKVPGDLKRKEVSHRLFVLIGDGLCTKESTTVFALRNTEDYCPKTCLRMSIRNARSMPNHGVEPTSAFLDSFLKHLPAFSSQDVTHLRETLLEKQILGIRHLIEKMGNEIPAIYIQSIFKEIGSSEISTLKEMVKAKKGKALAKKGFSPTVKKSVHNLRVKEMNEPANWPERILLKEKYACLKSNSELEHVLKPEEAAFLKMDELLTKLQSVEKCKNNIFTTNHNSDIFSSSSQPCWPEAIYRNFPDVYYCSDRSREAKQQQLNCLEARHIAYDTVSSLKGDSEEQERQVTPRLLSLIGGSKDPHPKKTSPKKQSNQIQPPKMQTRNAKDKDNNKKTLQSGLSEKNLQKLRIAVVDALELHNIRLENPLFKTCAKKLFTICTAFAKDVVGTGSASKLFMGIAESHAQQVIHFETNRPTLNLRHKRQRTQ